MSGACQAERPPGALFGETRGVALSSGGCRPDQNLNFAAEGGGWDGNDNWGPPTPGHARAGRPEEAEGCPKDAPAGPKTPSEGGEDVRSPPEGAEFGGQEGEKPLPRGRPEEAGRAPSSPLEDNGYASSSLSIDSPEAGGPAAWGPEDWGGLGGEEALPGAGPAASPPGPEALFPALAEAFRGLQDKRRLKEREKEKHRVRLVMYRRLALLRWIRGLQQKVLDQQSRLQESFDTILDNRKELIRCVQRGTGHPRSNPAQAEP